MDAYTGELAALGTAISFAFGSTLFTLAGRRIGSPLVNRSRLLIALIAIGLFHLFQEGQLLPLSAGIEAWGWLAISGVVGLVLGDASLFQAFVMVGPRLSMLMMALAPVLSVILAWLFLGEQLTPQQLGGIALTVAGIGVVVLERPGKLARKGKPRIVAQGEVALEKGFSREFFIGLAFGFGGALGQAGGLILSKFGLDATDISALSANFIRILTAAALIWTFTILRRQFISSFQNLRQNPRALSYLTGGALIGPVFGVWLSLVAIQFAPVGIASTLMALTPVFLLPIGYFVFGERISIQAIVGTAIAFIGSALLFL